MRLSNLMLMFSGEIRRKNTHYTPIQDPLSSLQDRAQRDPMGSTTSRCNEIVEYGRVMDVDSKSFRAERVRAGC
jgi:hypothetical protein